MSKFVFAFYGDFGDKELRQNVPRVQHSATKASICAGKPTWHRICYCCSVERKELYPHNETARVETAIGITLCHKS